VLTSAKDFGSMATKFGEGSDPAVASTVNVKPFSCEPSALVKPEIATRVPGAKLFVAVKVTTFEVIEKDVIVAAEQPTPVQGPSGAGMLEISVSGALFPPVEMVLVVVTTSAMAPASQMLTYTWLLSVAAVANIRNRVVPGAYVAAGAQDETGAMPYCEEANRGGANSGSENEGASKFDVGCFGVMLSASNTVSIGTMHAVTPKFASEQLLSVA
jgi:hypothetical protein